MAQYAQRGMGKASWGFQTALVSKEGPAMFYPTWVSKTADTQLYLRSWSKADLCK